MCGDFVRIKMHVRSQAVARVAASSLLAYNFSLSVAFARPCDSRLGYYGMCFNFLGFDQAEGAEALVHAYVLVVGFVPFLGICGLPGLHQSSRWMCGVGRRCCMGDGVRVLHPMCL